MPHNLPYFINWSQIYILRQPPYTEVLDYRKNKKYSLLEGKEDPFSASSFYANGILSRSAFKVNVVLIPAFFVFFFVFCQQTKEMNKLAENTTFDLTWLDLTWLDLECICVTDLAQRQRKKSVCVFDEISVDLFVLFCDVVVLWYGKSYVYNVFKHIKYVISRCVYVYI